MGFAIKIVIIQNVIVIPSREEDAFHTGKSNDSFSERVITAEKWWIKIFLAFIISQAVSFDTHLSDLK